ncbi:MAG: response regulator transcription factor [Elusimicrobia bacterium]|nr:response regulator transcription factor [Elusimicrobiota bacterium]
MRPSAACLTADLSARTFLRSALKGFALRFYPSASAFLKSPPSKGLAVIDASLPDMSGPDLAAVLRGSPRTSSLLLVLTGPGPYSPAAAASSLDSGADEYFRFPADPALFRARLLNLLERGRGRGAAKSEPEEFRIGPLRISPEARTAVVSGRKVPLTALEFDMLLYFLRNRGRVVSRYVLLEQVWREGLGSGPRAVDKRVEALRRKLGPFGSRLRTAFGLGYTFK